jgi:L-aminopeptidase/D-esterase-like protein
LYGAGFGVPGEFDWLVPPSADELAAAADLVDDRRPPRPLNTTIGVVATTVPLAKAQCARLAGAAQDGLARAIRPAHTMFDGDTVFGLSVAGSGSDPVSPWLFHEVLAAAADCFTRAVVHGVLSAASVTTAAGSWPAYLEAFPSARANSPYPRTD